MTPVSTRYGPHLLILLLLASVPVLVHFYVGVRADACANPGALRETAGIAGSRLGRERPDMHHRTRVQWTEGFVDMGRPGQRELAFRIQRSFEPSRYYLGPTAYRAATPFADRAELRWVDADGEKLPVHLLYDRSEPRVKLSAYLYVYDSQPVWHPFPASLGSAPWQLVHGTRPLTFYLVYGSVPRARVAVAEELATQWLVAAWKHYRGVCSP